jgi:hypothetical protein
MRHAADFSESENKDNKRNDEQPRFARNQQQNSCAQNSGHQQINQNRQAKFHGGNCNDFSAARKNSRKFFDCNRFSNGCGLQTLACIADFQSRGCNKLQPLLERGNGILTSLNCWLLSSAKTERLTADFLKLL